MDRLESAYQEYHYLLASWRHTRGQAFQLAATWNGVSVAELKQYVAAQGLKTLRRIGGESA